MPQFSLLVRVQNPDPRLFERMFYSVLAQSNNSFELVLLVSDTEAGDEAYARGIAYDFPNVRIERRPAGELVAWSCNALLSRLGTWVGFLGQYDQLEPNALAWVAEAIQANQSARVIYSDEEAVGFWGQHSLQFAKGAFDPVRLLTEEYLRDLAIIQTDWLIVNGGFDRRASDHPRHDIYFRLMEQSGAQAFAHIPRSLYLRHRNRLVETTGDAKHSPYLPRYDIDSVRRHLNRIELPAEVKQINGTLDVDFQLERSPSVMVLLVVGDDLAEGKARLAGIGTLPQYQPWEVRVLFHGQEEEIFDRYTDLCKGLRYLLKRIQGSLPEGLNQEMVTVDTDLALVLQAVPLTAHWLKRMVAMTALPSISATGPILMTPTRMTEPGCLEAVTEGLPWDSRGSLNHLAVPHSVSVLSPACLLVDTRRFLEIGGFEPDYPTLFGMDLTMRLTRAGFRCARTPRVHMLVPAGPAPAVEEAELFSTAWAGWEDPYLLHQLP